MFTGLFNLRLSAIEHYIAEEKDRQNHVNKFDQIQLDQQNHNIEKIEQQIIKLGDQFNTLIIAQKEYHDHLDRAVRQISEPRTIMKNKASQTEHLFVVVDYEDT